MKAKFSGKCLCGAIFHKGAEIEWSPGLRKAVKCPACAKVGK